MRTLLLIAIFFPPIGEVGSKRPLHLVRHLPKHGWQPVVLAGDPAIEKADPALAGFIPAGTTVRYAFGRVAESPTPDRPWERRSRDPGGRDGRESRAADDRPTSGAAQPRPGREGEPSGRGRGRGISYLDPFDRYLKAIPAGLAAAREMIREFRPAAISVCADPWSALLAGSMLQRETGLPLIADLRDPWSLHAGKMALRSPPTRAVIRFLERRAFRRAARIVLNTERCRDLYRAEFAGRLPAERFEAIRNAFDRELFTAAEPKRPPAFTLLHYGDFRSFVPGAPLLAGFARFVAAEQLTPEAARIVVTGPARQEEAALAQSLGLTPFIEYRAAVPYADTLAVLRAADVLVLANGNDAPVIPSKLYDYLAARRPILSLSAEPESNRIVTETSSGMVADPSSPEGVAAVIAALYRQTRGADWSALPEAAVRAYSAESQAERFAAVLDAVTA